ncbi:DUF72 domain-containing protein [Tianweitania sp. BSSL-BM11]|uniref:DUF72 domain-containing protein n=1 Tax=Tianweitania aestuarii TaxID=2814886 RepID=A0ABS5RYJ5_9HYPH|nr:DUF72 domain-containing protein [Tianweitania aestuarii]MBS9722118.1 DUF72 domain-containing protein [Tianweitania aestuarii]
MAPSSVSTSKAEKRPPARLRIGTAGWSVPKDISDQFPAEGTHLQRYVARFNAAEINSSFYRPHRRTTYQRWAASVPEDFRFSVKLPKTISHDPSAEDQEALIARFADEVQGLGEKLGVLLVQFPPKHAFNSTAADTLFGRLKTALPCLIACEPRHASWFTPAANDCLFHHQIARVAADPAPVDGADQPGGWPGLRYYRLHGSPVIYRSSYPTKRLAGLLETLLAETKAGTEAWCIFDNTASFAATSNALTLAGLAEQE